MQGWLLIASVVAIPLLTQDDMRTPQAVVALGVFCLLCFMAGRASQ